jgi:hypothetical protein
LLVLFFAFGQAVSDASQQRPGKSRYVIKERVESATVDHFESHVSRRYDRSRAGYGVEQCNLAEVVARTNTGHYLVVLDDVGLTCDDQSKFLTQVALAHDGSTLLNVDLIGESLDLKQLIFGEICKYW